MASDETQYGFTVGQTVEARKSSGEAWHRGTVNKFYSYDDGEPILIKWDEGVYDDETWWCRVSNVRAVPADTAHTLQWALDRDGGYLTRQRGDWNTVHIGDNEVSIAIPPCGHHQRIRLRNVPAKQDSEIIAELRRVMDSGETFTRGKVTSILNGEF
jgi:hypothetical protein